VKRLSFVRGSAAVGLIAGASLAPAPLLAQPGGVAPSCSIDPNSPKELAMMELTVQRAKGAQAPAERQTLLKGIMKELDTKPERFNKNLAGYNLRWSQAVQMWAVEPGIGLTPTRGAIGLVTNPTEPIDLVQKYLESLDAIAKAQPSCAAEMKAQRQSDLWLAITQKALEASNGGNPDSAEFYAKKSLALSDASPYPYYILANVANAKKDRANAIANWKQVITSSGTDSSYKELKNSSLYLLSVNQLEAAEAAQGAEQKAAAKEAAESFKQLMAATPDSPDVPNIMNSWAEAMRMAGDSANVPSIYADMVAKPANFSEAALTMGGVIATRINKADDAAALFEGVIAKNPNARDALRNLAATYYGKDQYQKMFAPTQKLVAIDPNNFDGWMMFAYAAQGIAKGVKAPAEKKAWTDTLVKYQTIAEALPVKVDISSFQRTSKDVTLTLQFEQMAAADGSYSVTVEFLDQAGSVVGTATENVGPLKKGAPKAVPFKAAATNVVAYRYKPLK
jgi:tetratricopeptide (TPR) repeat protein